MPKKALKPRSCCCCIEDVKIVGVEEIDGRHPTRRGDWRGISFSLLITLAYERNGDQDCELEWYERADPTAETPWEGSKDWVNLSKIVQEKPAPAQSLPPKRGQRRGWNFRDKPCPGSEVVEIADPPALKKDGDVQKRTLWIAIRTKSGSDCPEHCKSWIGYTVINLSAEEKPTHRPIKEAEAKGLPWEWAKDQRQDFLP